MNAYCAACNQTLEDKLINNITKGNKVYDVYVCKACSIGLTVPQPSPEELTRLYHSGIYRDYTGRKFNPLIECLIYLFQLQRKRDIKQSVRGNSILDIGCGRGVFLHLMDKDGWNVTGLEMDKETASYAFKSYGLNILSGDLLKADLPNETFDVITINHVLEHVYKPKEMIQECRRLLKKGGLLLISTPNVFSCQAVAGKRVWFHLDIPFHLHHFSERGLSSLVQNHSFRVRKIKRFDVVYNPFGWLQTLLNLTGLTENVFYDLLKSRHMRQREKICVSQWELLVTFALLPIYIPLSFLLSIYESAIKRGGTIQLYAIKE